MKIEDIYYLLLDKYGPQGWWPLYTLRNSNGRNKKGYISGSADKTPGLSAAGRYEIAIGAVLTQNTSWTNVEKALANLVELNLLDPVKISNLEQDKLAVAVKPSGYFNQKAKKIKILTDFLLDGNYLPHGNTPDRDDLLNLWGIGEETADSILLYAYNLPLFVVDTYTRRIFSRLGFLDGSEKYSDISELFVSELPPGSILFNEFHALIVKHAKEHCRKKPDCSGCILKSVCKYNNPFPGGKQEE